jgi:hypothetical protein
MEIIQDELRPMDLMPYKEGIARYRQWFREAVDAADAWRQEAQEDYDFVAGQQWTDAEVKDFEEQHRPTLTINRIKPIINVVSGYQRVNRYDIDFKPRTGDDIDICQVRKGVTKYIMDECDFDAQESQAFLDAIISGLGWFSVGYRWDDEIGDGSAFVNREDPFGIYVDPEAHKSDFSDAKYICRARWVDKDELKIQFPEHADAIEAAYNVYDNAESDYTQRKIKADTLWFKAETQKIRLVECWYKTREQVTLIRLMDGTEIEEEDLTMDMLMAGIVDPSPEAERKITRKVVRYASFFDTVLLEDMPSPYEHGEFPFVPITCFYYGTGDIPAGFVRDLKDPQREINKRRIQTLHILNTMSNGGGWYEKTAMDADQLEEFEKMHTVPGHFQQVADGALTGNKIRERETSNPPAALIQAEAQATQDLTSISGINEAQMGIDIPNASSGRAIELKQKQALTHIAPIFDQLRKAKKKIAELLWGRRGHKGIIPQFYTTEKVYRIEGPSGEQFVAVNQQVQVGQDALGNVITKTLNDLSQGEFDVVVADAQASTTQRQAQLWTLVDAIKNLGIPGDMMFDSIIELSDLPNKEQIKQTWQARQQAQQQAQEAQLRLEMIKQQDHNLNQNISFKDAPLPIQLSMAARQGLVPPEIAQYAIQLWTQQIFPGLASQMGQTPPQDQQALQQQQMLQMAIQQAAQMQQGQGGGQQPQQSPMTQAAAQSILAGQGPAV